MAKSRVVGPYSGPTCLALQGHACSVDAPGKHPPGGKNQTQKPAWGFICCVWNRQICSDSRSVEPGTWGRGGWWGWGVTANGHGVSFLVMKVSWNLDSGDGCTTL